MNSRRHFLQTLAAVPPLFAAGRTWAQADPSKLALVIGNSAYAESPLANPINDAKAMSGLFTDAGFTVDARTNATRVGMLESLERLNQAIKRPEVKTVVFYYAGHGAQLEWRNYLLPVDVSVESPDDLKRHCVDLNQVMAQLGTVRDKTFIIILDACRNNPFGSAYRPDQKGLSQFDAPFGSLLAYATSPGNVASDGEGKNGLYTENLVRELSKPNLRLEDAFKRVRLNVRLASRGAQVPWETTSLENDVFIMGGGNKKLSEAEEEKLLEADFAAWTRAKASNKLADWVAYLNQFPNGRFSEIAQARINRAMEEADKGRRAQENAAVTTPAPTPPKGAPMIVLGDGSKTPQFFQPSANPYSKGAYPLGRRFSIGDEYTSVVSDLLTGVEQLRRRGVVTRVDVEADLVEINNGQLVLDLLGNPIVGNNGATATMPRQYAPTELYVGKKWKVGYKEQHPRFGERVYDLNASIVALERVKVPAGEFDAFRIQMDGGNQGRTGVARGRIVHWVVPGLNVRIKEESLWRSNGAITLSERMELVSAKQLTVDLGCAMLPTGTTPTLVIKNSCD